MGMESREEGASLGASPEERLQLAQRADPEILCRRGVGPKLHEMNLARYQFAADGIREHLKGGEALDVACGLGFGTKVIADSCPQLKRVTGFDLCQETIDRAKGEYADSRVQFAVRDLNETVGTSSLDGVVTVDTLQHLRKPREFVRHLAARLKAGGVMIASSCVSPDRDLNFFHLHDFTPDTFRELFKGLGLEVMKAVSHERWRDRLSSLMQAREIRDLHNSRQEAKSDRVDGLGKFYLKNPGLWFRRLRERLGLATQGDYGDKLPSRRELYRERKGIMVRYDTLLMKKRH